MHLDAEKERQIGEIFDVFDVDKSGTIDASEMRTAMQALGFQPSKEELTSMIFAADDNG